MKANWTGERLETFLLDESTIEHLHRYALAKEYVKNKNVLDLACGEGYGSNLLAEEASFVDGADIDPETIARARNKYKNKKLKFTEAKAEALPYPSACFDVVVSFETIEHVSDHDQFFAEIKRVLKQDGLLIISSPDKKNYSDATGYKNPFHLHELYREEFSNKLKNNFSDVHFFYQRLMVASLAISQEKPGLDFYEGNYETLHKRDGIEPHYIIALASDLPIESKASSIFTSQLVLESALKRREMELKKTITYRLGNILLSPFKLFRQLFTNKKINREH